MLYSVEFRGLELGLLALLTNLALLPFIHHVIFTPIGNVFLFLAACSLEPVGIFIALTTALIPFAMLMPDVAFEQLRTVILCLVLAYTSRVFQRVPPFILGLGIWVIIFWPLHALLLIYGLLSPYSTPSSLALSGFGDIFLLLIAGTLLLSHSVWRELSGMQHRKISLANVFTHLLSGTAALSMYGILIIGSDGSPDILLDEYAPDNLFWLCAFATVCISVPAFLAYRLAMLFESNSSDFKLASMFKTQRAFSGLSSDFWRRKKDQELISETNTISAQMQSFSDTNAPEQAEPDSSPLSDKGVCVIKRDGTVSFVNRKFRRFTGISENQIIGKNIEELGIYSPAASRIRKLLERSLEKGPSVIELKINELPDRVRFYETTSYRSDALPESSLGGEPDAIIIAMKDITERRVIEQHLFKAQKLESLGSMVNNLALALGHSFDYITAKAREGQQNIENASEKLSRISEEAQRAKVDIEHLTEFASDRPGLMEVLPLGKFLRERLVLLQNAAGENCQIIIDGPDTAQLPVRCDCNLLIQAIISLVLNARESYGNSQGSVFLSLGLEHLDEDVSDIIAGAQQGDFARLRIKDSGCGMTTEVLAKAFDPLFTTKTGAHTGLGLSIAFSVIRAHDGFLTLESHPARGSTVSIYLPVEEG